MAKSPIGGRFESATSPEGSLYLPAILDAFSRRVVGWAMGGRATAELVIDALDMAARNHRLDAGTAHHSDHGCQYTALAFGKVAAETGLATSMGTVGDAPDNAFAESFFANLQTELPDRRRWNIKQSWEEFPISAQNMPLDC